jgi:CheY-like chemotaxis protein
MSRAANRVNREGGTPWTGAVISAIGIGFVPQPQPTSYNGPPPSHPRLGGVHIILNKNPLHRKTFMLIYCIMKAHKILRKGGSAKAALQCQTHPPQRILVVEDEPDIRKLDTEVLRESGFQVANAKNGIAALHTLNTERLDLVIIEEEMSLVTGLELVKALRSEDILTPVILVLAAMPTMESNPNRWAQVQAILIKPYTVAELYKTVKEVLRSAGTVAYFPSGPPTNWQSPVCSRWVSDLNT